jgi:hypothetical protein
MGQLTRAEMEQVIKDGGAVLHNGQTLWKLDHLPSEADLAAGDPEAEAIVQGALDTQIRHLQQQRDKLAARGQSATLQPQPEPQPEKATKKAAADSGKG